MPWRAGACPQHVGMDENARQFTHGNRGGQRRVSLRRPVLYPTELRARAFMLSVETRWTLRRNDNERASRLPKNQEPSWAPGLRGGGAAGMPSRRERATIVGLVSNAFASMEGARNFKWANIGRSLLPLAGRRGLRESRTAGIWLRLTTPRTLPPMA